MTKSELVELITNRMPVSIDDRENHRRQWIVRSCFHARFGLVEVGAEITLNGSIAFERCVSILRARTLKVSRVDAVDSHAGAACLGVPKPRYGWA